MRLRIFWLALVAASPCLAADSSVGGRIVAGFKAALPGFDADADASTLHFGPPGQVFYASDFKTVTAACTDKPADCDKAISDFVAETVAFARAHALPMRAAALRAAVRSKAYVDNWQAWLDHATAGRRAFVFAPLTHDLTIQCWIEMPRHPITNYDLPTMGLDSAAALTRCEANTRAALPLLAAIRPPASGIGELRGETYESSTLIFPGDWAPLAARFGGHLLVAAPSQDVVLYAREADAAALARRAGDIFASADREGSPKLYRWTRTGWEDYAPPISGSPR